MSLREGDYRKILDITVAILDSRAADAAWALFVGQVMDAVSGEVGWMYTDVDFERNAGRACAWSPGTVGGLPLESLRRAHMPDHPLARHLAATRDPAPVTVHDVISDREWRNSPARSSLLNTFGVTRQLALVVPTSTRTWRTCLISRSGSDFTDANREFARRIQPVVSRLDRHLRELDRLRELERAQSVAAAEIGLTPRELTVLALLAEGLTADALAHRLGISVRTAVKHLEHIYRKFGTTDRLSTVLLAQQLRLVPGPVRLT